MRVTSSRLMDATSPDRTPPTSGVTVETFFTTLIGRDQSGRSWLPALLAATPNGGARLGDIAEDPGSLDAPLAVVGASGRLACFDHPATPPRRLLRWYVDHPEELSWPPDAKLSAATMRLRRALLFDQPRGSQAKAQERARELVDASPSRSPEWWKFEDTATLDCVLSTHRLVVTIVASEHETLGPATAWYTARSVLVRALEASQQLASGRHSTTLLLSDVPMAEGADDSLERSLPAASPHLTDAGRAELQTAYLGNVTWGQACDAAGLERAAVNK
jgi:hypothetical protein